RPADEPRRCAGAAGGAVAGRRGGAQIPRRHPPHAGLQAPAVAGQIGALRRQETARHARRRRVTTAGPGFAIVPESLRESRGMKITMVGAGYVGLVTGVCLADFGHEVSCVDTDQQRIAALRRGELPIYEPGLSELVVANLAAGRLSFTTNLAEAVPQADVVFLAVG